MTGVGIAGMATAIIFAVESTPDAYSKIKNEEYKRATDGDDTPLTTSDIVSMTWRDYAPAAAMFAISAGMIIGGQYIQTKRTIAMTAAYTMLADQANKYHEHVKELAGKSKAEDSRSKASQNIVNNIDDAEFENAQSFKGGTDYFVDALSERIFKYDIRFFERDVNKFNKELMNEMWKPVNDLYYEIGLKPTIMGAIVGYDIDKGFLEFKKPYVEERNGHPVFVLWPENYPEERKKKCGDFS